MLASRVDNNPLLPRDARAHGACDGKFVWYAKVECPTLYICMPPSTAPKSSANRASPFALANEAAYRRWRAAKLADYPEDAAALIVQVADPCRLTAAEHASLRARCRKTNMAIYAGPGAPAADNKTIVHGVASAMGLSRLTTNLLADEDGVSSVQVMPAKAQRGYIPYTDKRLSWHTDGYYNPPAESIRAFILHCVRPAAGGGENALLDPEMIYLQLRDASPDHVAALMAPDALTIPANTEAGDVRAASVGPVFSIDSETGNLHMRYTARTRSIAWKQDAATLAAVACLQGLLADDSPFVFRHRLAAGEGLVCNNVLHNRTAFTDAAHAPRLIQRARYYDRIAGTDVGDIIEGR